MKIRDLTWYLLPQGTILCTCLCVYNNIHFVILLCKYKVHGVTNAHVILVKSPVTTGLSTLKFFWSRKVPPPCRHRHSRPSLCHAITWTKYRVSVREGGRRWDSRQCRHHPGPGRGCGDSRQSTGEWAGENRWWGTPRSGLECRASTRLPDWRDTILRTIKPWGLTWSDDYGTHQGRQQAQWLPGCC